MRLAAAVLLALVTIAGTPGAARAQDRARVGLTMGYPSSVGVVWQVSDRVALRPELTLSRSTGDSSTNDLAGAVPVSTNDSTGVGAGASALFYLHRWEGLRTYVSPRFSYARTSTSASTAGTTSTAESTVSSYLTSGSFGAQYSLGRHFGLFGEIGLGYSATSTALTSTLTTGVTSVVNGVLTSSTRTQAVQSSSHANTLATRSGVGVIFYF
jgi:hypothetical protein